MGDGLSVECLSHVRPLPKSRHLGATAFSVDATHLHFPCPGIVKVPPTGTNSCCPVLATVGEMRGAQIPDATAYSMDGLREIGEHTPDYNVCRG